ncbi:hypothetical protein O7605_31815 [Verrucosispora sp. WMMA2121]|uniref:hypothetical protein n=1 Tax=Verrucosispora sp. WMMA2121 TaxID=3015164 RepID=UPI0022B64F62|nr:hypothetical protein [Verrucosispora sp. WMMA2121]MCZ7423773.1 hypothetical protein [Verrucosispora sp. WMMA2121]MCZ7424085.1 hypothetical protein [Verrucosispora sp. WMMA2121]MCZ7424100.1 hypothetical protein [Verrucosispora sp. WMMA2121]
MFLTDPVLRRIAADTNDVLPEHLWRHDTATPEPIGDLARILHTTARDFTDSTTSLDEALARVGMLSTAARHAMAARADLHIAAYQQTLTDALVARERHAVLGAALLTCYRAWRNHRPIADGDERHLLLRRCDPSRGVATLRRTDPHTWQVTPDAEAATAFDIPYPDRVVGEVTETDHGWTPTAYIARPHQAPLATVYPLPVRGELASACRSLLRWWHLRHSDAWRNRTPTQLTPTEIAHLTS